jgi:predicted nucleic acid-binding protein
VPGTIVVDASFAAAWVLPEVHSAAAIARLNDWETVSVVRLVPALYAAEAASLCRKHVGKVTLDEVRAMAALRLLLETVTIQADNGNLAYRALEISGQIGAGRAYDSVYVARAENIGCDLWTGDERLYNGAHTRFPFV